MGTLSANYIREYVSDFGGTPDDMISPFIRAAYEEYAGRVWGLMKFLYFINRTEIKPDGYSPLEIRGLWLGGLKRFIEERKPRIMERAREDIRRDLEGLRGRDYADPGIMKLYGIPGEQAPGALDIG